jgi:uncharacterized protein DUF4435
MSRLRYSERAFVRSLQLSRHDLFIFVEGWSDRYFYDKICQSLCPAINLTYSLRTAAELPGQTGGKEALIYFFSFLRSQRLLLHAFKGKKLAVAFFLDKDVDDYLKRKKRSPHIIYTEYYCLENHLLKYCNLTDAVAAAASLDLASVDAAFGVQEAWMSKAAAEWQDWVELCLLARALNSNCSCGYHRHSQVNKGPYGGIDQTAYTQAKATIQAAISLPPVSFHRRLAKIERYVRNVYSSGEHDRVFKGKWYAAFAAEDVKKAAAGRAFNSNGFESRLLAIAAASIDTTKGWCEYFKEPLRILATNFQNFT